MSDEPPTPPAELPTEILNTLNGYSPDRLQAVASYAETLAEHKEREARLAEESDQGDVERRPDDLPEDVPAKATITVKEINTTATTTGNDGTVIKFDPSTRDPSIRNEYSI